MAAERRLRRRLRLQVSERRAGRAGVRLGASAAHRVDGSRQAGGSRYRAGSVTPRRSRSRPSTSRPAASRVSSAARRPCCRWPRSSAASIPCWRQNAPAASRRSGRSRLALTDLFIDAGGRRAAPATVSRSSRRASAAERGSQVSFAHPTRRLRDHAGADRPRRDRRLPRAGHPALRLHAALHALRRRVGRRRSPARVLESGEWRDPRFAVRAAVT